MNTSKPPALSPLTIERLLKIKAAILAEPKLYDQNRWCVPDATKHDEFSDGCGTPGCIFGWANQFADVKIPVVEVESLFFQNAAEWLGLVGQGRGDYWKYDSPATRLYDILFWPERFAVAYSSAEADRDFAIRAQAAADRIDHFIATDGRE